MANMVIIYYSSTGNAYKVALAIEAGAQLEEYSAADDEGPFFIQHPRRYRDPPSAAVTEMSPGCRLCPPQPASPLHI